MLTKLRASILGLLKSCSGAAGVEYGLLVSLIALAIILSVGLLGETMTQSYEKFEVAVSEKSNEETNNPGNSGGSNSGNSGGNNPGNPHGFDGENNPGKGAPTPGGGRENNQ